MPWFGPYGIDPDGSGPIGTFMFTPSVKRVGNTLEYEQVGIGYWGMSTGFQPYALPNTSLTIIQPAL